MQVSQIGLVDTHAIIGGGQAKAFGMSDSAEFFTVLSSTLYRDKVRAVVRETICNGWDAHIAAGRTDQKLRITISDTEVIFQDFGKGIADKRIVPIYCVYGASTKVADGEQTGGFGLGSKSPFAYSDHFTVTSCHEGVKTVYAISRGGIETKGRPGIRTMVRVPTEETGITVSIPLKSKEDRADFSSNIHSVVYQGGINAELVSITDSNGTPKTTTTKLNTIDYTAARKTGYMAVTSYELGESLFYVLYGTVLYPVSTADKELAYAIEDAAKVFGSHRSRERIVLIARPNSLGVTPSRESLSYTEETKAEILRMLRKFRNEVKQAVPAAAKLTIDHLFQRVGDYSKHPLPRVELHNACTGDERRESAVYIAGLNIRSLASDKQTGKFWLRAAIKANPGFRKAIKKHYLQDGVSDVLLHGSMRLHLRLAAKLGLLDALHVARPGWGIGSVLPKAKKALSARHTDTVVSPHIFIAPNHKAAGQLVRDHKDTFRNERGATAYDTGFCFIVKKPSAKLLSDLQTLAAKYKLTVHSADFDAKPKPTPRVQKGPLKYLELGGKHYAPTLEKPEFVLKATPHRLDMFIEQTAESRRLQSFLGKTAVVTTNDDYQRLIKAGAKPVFAEVEKQLASLAKRSSVLFRINLLAGDLFHYPGEAGLLVQELCLQDNRFARFFYNVKLSSETEIDDWQALTVIATKEILPPTPADAARVTELLRATEKKAKEQYAHLAAEFAKVQFPYVEHLVALGVKRATFSNLKLFESKSRTKMLDSALSILKMLKRAEPAKAGVTNQPVETLKEAA